MVLRYDEMVPEAYLQTSRDFQTLTRLFSVGLSASKLDADNIIYLNNPEYINNRMLYLLETKLGFFTKKEYPDDYIRKVLSAFNYIMRNKGNINSIICAIQLYFKIHNAKAYAQIELSDDYELRIGLQGEISNTDLLQELLRYVLPAGIKLDIYFFEKKKEQTDFYASTAKTIYVISEDTELGEIFHVDASENYEIKHQIDTITVEPGTRSS